MDFLTTLQCTEWCRAHGVTPAQSMSTIGKGPGRIPQLLFSSPVQSSKQVAFVSGFLDLGDPIAPSLLWITDWPLYKPVEMELLTIWRSAFGEKRPLIDAPGQLFVEGETQLAGSLFLLVMAFGWDGYLIVPRADFGVFLSHDQVMVHFGSPSRLMDRSIDLCNQLNLKQLNG